MAVTAKHVRAAYENLATYPGDYVSLTDLRNALGGTRREVDAAFKQLNGEPDVTFAPEENQKVLTSIDHVAAWRLGGQAIHLLTID